MFKVHQGLAGNKTLKAYEWHDDRSVSYDDEGLFHALLENSSLEYVKFPQRILSETGVTTLASVLEGNRNLETIEVCGDRGDYTPVHQLWMLRLIEAMRGSRYTRLIFLCFDQTDETIMSALIAAARENIYVSNVINRLVHTMSHATAPMVRELGSIYHRNHLIREWKAPMHSLVALSKFLPWELCLEVGSHILEGTVTATELGALLPTLDH